LKKALFYESKVIENYDAQINDSTACTVLNICAILSALGKHQHALNYALQAIANLTS
jgi:hypothetical protein